VTSCSKSRKTTKTGAGVAPGMTDITDGQESGLNLEGTGGMDGIHMEIFLFYFKL
jgi:hypothetical protein